MLNAEQTKKIIPMKVERKKNCKGGPWVSFCSNILDLKQKSHSLGILGGADYKHATRAALSSKDQEGGSVARQKTFRQLLLMSAKTHKCNAAHCFSPGCYTCTHLPTHGGFLEQGSALLLPTRVVFGVSLL
jgi:hypothetical protein